MVNDLLLKSKPKTGAELMDCVGLLPKYDKEYERIQKELKAAWRKWRILLT